MKWINVDDRLPEANTEVLVNTVLDNIYIGLLVRIGEGYYQWNVSTMSGTLYFHDRGFCHITHWMALPELPE